MSESTQEAPDGLPNEPPGEVVGAISDPEEVLDWDASLKERPAPLASGTLRVRLRYAGPVMPMPVESPWTE